MAENSTRQGRRTDVPAASAGTAPPATGFAQDTGAVAGGKPRRIQLSRAKGWRMPPGAVKVDRSTKWGNPFVVNHPGSALEKPMDPALAVQSFRMLLEKEGCWSPVPLPWPKGKIPAQWTTVEDVIRELRGKDLACWCQPGAPCHADVLLEIANG
ncbi:DUF4326 domain-containing protein [Cereibacter sphaeroides]|uniref:DUF4326 domain-containing protein n=1 Tax=Cereibacter sphaeroides TaxID=1063 RepID=UPI001E3FB4F9|nr:DUF4326 domain-containing protein [Cereibacter sphaeroides]